MDKLNDLEVCKFDLGGTTATYVYKGSLRNLEKVDDLEWREVDGEEILSLKEIYEQLKGKCYMITVFVDSPLHGEIYQCGNYGDGLWVEYGTTKGYA